MKAVKIKDMVIGKIYQDIEDIDLEPCVMKLIEVKEKSIVFKYIRGYNGYIINSKNNEIEFDLQNDSNFTFLEIQ